MKAASDLTRYENLVRTKQATDAAIDKLRADHLAAYAEPRPEGEPHEPGCQRSPARYGEMAGVACTCDSNAERRRAAIFAAGAAGDIIARDGLGSFEQSTWHDGRASVIQGHANPYRRKT